MKKYRPLIVALPDPVVTEGTVEFFRSYCKHLSRQADMIVPVDVSPTLKELIQECCANVVRSEKPAMKHLRSADVISRLARDQPDRPVLVIRPGRTVFQNDQIFRYCEPHAVTLSAEGGTVTHDVWNRESWADFNAAMKGPLRAESPADIQIVSTVVAAGPAYLMSVFEYARFAFEARSGVQDQSAITALAEWSRTWPWMSVLPATTPWVAHGHWAMQLGMVFDKEVAVSKISGDPYAIFHDWHRVKHVSRFVQRAYA